jgi:hypothetical protein
MQDLDGNFAAVIGVLFAVGGADFWNPVGWVLLAAAVIVTAVWVGIEIGNNIRSQGVMEMAHKEKRPSRSAESAKPHESTRNGKSGADKHTKRASHGGRGNGKVPPNPNKRRR